MQSPIRNRLIATALAVGGIGGMYSLEKAFDLVDKFEGNVKTVYLDPLKIKTICRGTTHGPLIAKGKATADECDRATLDDLKTAAAIVKRCTNGAPMTQGEFNAWVSFTLNVGPGARGVKDGFCMLKSGKVPSHLRYIQREPYAIQNRLAACDMLFDWTMPGTVVYNGLLRRRTDEHRVCVGDLQ